MNVITLVDCQDICNGLFEGSYISDVSEDEEIYTGMWSSQWGTYEVSVPKYRCKIESNES